jgi:signal transduction histidine kinase
MQTKGGEERVMLLSIEGIEIDGQRCLMHSGQDITERTLAEAALRLSEERLRALSARLQSAREEEGQRIAREIHDELGGALTGLKWDLEGIGRTLSGLEHDGKVHSVREKIPAMTTLIENTITTVRRISSELRPAVLDDLGLIAAIEWQAQQFQARTGIHCDCENVVDAVDLNLEAKTAVFRIFQEILTNVLRHAQATRVAVNVRKEADRFVLEVKDNGRGITDDDGSGAGSFGILGMKERALLVDGEVAIYGATGVGTSVIVRVPIMS